MLSAARRLREFISGIRATTGSATLNVYASFSGSAEAGTTASLYADQAGGTVDAGGDSNVTSKTNVTTNVQADGNANVTSVQSVEGPIQATGAATVLGIQGVSG